MLLRVLVSGLFLTMVIGCGEQDVPDNGPGSGSGSSSGPGVETVSPAAATLPADSSAVADTRTEILSRIGTLKQTVMEKLPGTWNYSPTTEANAKRLFEELERNARTYPAANRNNLVAFADRELSAFEEKLKKEVLFPEPAATAPTKKKVAADANGFCTDEFTQDFTALSEKMLKSVDSMLSAATSPNPRAALRAVVKPLVDDTETLIKEYGEDAECKDKNSGDIVRVKDLKAQIDQLKGKF